MLAFIAVLALFAIAATVGACILFARSLSLKNRTQFDTFEDEPRTRRERREAEANAQGAKTNMIAAGVCGASALVLAIAIVALAVNEKSSGVSPGDEPATAANTPEGGQPSAPLVRKFDAEGLPIGNDFDAVIHRLNVRFQQGNTFLYGLEISNLKYLKSLPGFTRSREAFLAFQAHAGTPATPPPFIGMVSDAWREMLTYITKNDVPDLCRMLTTQPVESRQTDVLRKLGEYDDPRCAATIAPFLKSDAHRYAVGQMLRKFDSEKLVLPYLGTSYNRDVRCEAVNILAVVGTAASARAVESLTRDPDSFVRNRADVAYDALGRKFNVGRDMVAVVADLKTAMATNDGMRHLTCVRQLDAAFRTDHPQRSSVFKALLALCTFPDPKGNTATELHHAMKWASGDDLKTVCETLVASEGSMSVFKKLEELRDVRSAETVAMFLTKPLLQTEATKVLKAIGPAAMKAVAVYAVPAYPNGAAIDLFTRWAAIDALGEMGTKECIPLLQQIGAAQLDYRDKALEAIKKIIARGR
jgi:HEAT repeat protein